MDTGPNRALRLTCFVLQGPPKMGQQRLSLWIRSQSSVVCFLVSFNWTSRARNSIQASFGISWLKGATKRVCALARINVILACGGAEGGRAERGCSSPTKMVIKAFQSRALCRAKAPGATEAIHGSFSARTSAAGQNVAFLRLNDSPRHASTRAVTQAFVY